MTYSVFTRPRQRPTSHIFITQDTQAAGKIIDYLHTCMGQYNEFQHRLYSLRDLQ